MTSMKLSLMRALSLVASHLPICSHPNSSNIPWCICADRMRGLRSTSTSPIKSSLERKSLSYTCCKLDQHQKFQSATSTTSLQVIMMNLEFAPHQSVNFLKHFWCPNLNSSPHTFSSQCRCKLSCSSSPKRTIPKYVQLTNLSDGGGFGTESISSSSQTGFKFLLITLVFDVCKHKSIDLSDAQNRKTFNLI